MELVRQAQVLAREGKGPRDARLGYIRNQLYTRLAPRWRSLQAGHPFRLYVHLAPSAEVLLRVHQPKVFGDHQAAGRPMLRDVLDDGRSRSGLGLAPGNLGMRAVVPLQVEQADETTTVGAIEVGLGVLNDLRQLDLELDAGVALLVRHNLLESPDSGESLRGLPARDQLWYLLDASRPEVRRWQRQRLLPTPDTGTTLKLIADDGHTYLLNQIVLSGYPYRQPNAAPAKAMALVWRDVSELFARHQEEKKRLIGKWLLAWLGAEALLLLLLFATRNGTRALMQRHQRALLDKHQQSEQARQLLTIITQAQAAYIDARNQYQVFADLLQRILELSASPYGFIGEVLHDADGPPYVRTYALRDLADQSACAETQPASLEIRDLDSLFGQVLDSGQPQIVNSPLASRQPSGLPTTHPPLRAAAGLPIFSRGQLVGLLGLLNRVDGYPHELIEQLHPLLATLGQLIDALRREPETLSDRQQAARAASDQMITEMSDADAIVIGAPMHNFTIPASLRTWIDHVARPGKTFGYDPDTGPKGLLDDKPVYVLSTRGGKYGDGSPENANPADFQSDYLRHILGFMGLKDVRIIAANGMDMGPEPRAEGMAEANTKIDAAVTDMAA